MRMVCIAALVGYCAAGRLHSARPRSLDPHNDVVVIHHVTGTKDTTETLTEKAIDPDDAKQLGLKKGQRFYQVADASASPTPAKAKKAEKVKDSDGASKDSRLSDQIRELRDEVEVVVAQNKRLQEQINSNSPSPSSSPARRQDETAHCTVPVNAKVSTSGLLTMPPLRRSWWRFTLTWPIRRCSPIIWMRSGIASFAPGRFSGNSMWLR